MLVPLLIIVQINWDSVDGSRWILLGGSTGSESQPDKSTSDIVSLVTLEQDSQYVDPTKWCSKNLASLPMELDGSAASWVDTRSFLASQLGNSSFSTAHHTTAFAGGLVCGGADREYRISRACWWYFPATDKWKKGPRLARARYGAVAVDLSGPSAGGNHPGGQVWVTGGRDGATVLQKNEVLQYPVIYRSSRSSPGYTLKRWLWANEKMKDAEIWQYGVKQPMYSLPIPLAGHCVVKLANRFVVFLGGATAQFDEFGSVIPHAGSEPTNEVHVYDLDNEVWATTFRDQDQHLRRMKVARMNHACVSYVENNRVKIMVGGGVTRGSDGISRFTQTVEVMDWTNKNWVSERNFPNLLSGGKLVVVDNRPTLIGRYGDEKQNSLLRLTSDTKVWRTLPYKLEAGRSDFSLLNVEEVSGISVNADTNSRMTKINPGTCGTPTWRDSLNKVVRGKKVVWRTNTQQHPWLQLDLKEEMNVIKVRFESGPVGVQTVEVRVSQESIPPSSEVNTLLTGDGTEVCGGGGTTVDGVNTMEVCCSLTGRFVTLQATGTTVAPLEISDIKITAEPPGCGGQQATCLVTPATVSTYDDSLNDGSCGTS